MKKNPFAYLKKAPKLKGHRILKPTEIIQPGDLYSFLSTFDIGAKPPAITDCCYVPDNPQAHMHVGGTLLDARKSFGAGFDGIVYRKLSKK